MSLQSLIATIDERPAYELPEMLAEDFPEYRRAILIPDPPVKGDLCLVESEGREFHGFYRPRRRGADFTRPSLTIRARTYRIVAVLRPVSLRAGFYS